MELRYEIQTSPAIYDEDFDEEYSDTDTYFYEPSQKEIEIAVADIIYQNYFKGVAIDTQTFKRKMKELLSDLDLEVENYFEEELQEYFKEKAYESYANC